MKKQTQEIINSFKKNKLNDLSMAQKILSVAEPPIGCNANEIIKDDAIRMETVAYFLYYYNLMELNIENFKKYSKPSNYDKETIEMIESQLFFNKAEYDNALKKIRNFNSETYENENEVEI